MNEEDPVKKDLEFTESRKEKRKSQMKDWWSSESKRYNRVIINMPDDVHKWLEKMSVETQKPISKLIPEILDQVQKKEPITIIGKETEASKKAMIKETLQIFRGLSNNVNQMARNINQKRILNPLKTNITRTEKQALFQKIEALEEMVLDLVNKTT